MNELFFIKFYPPNVLSWPSESVNNIKASKSYDPDFFLSRFSEHVNNNKLSDSWSNLKNDRFLSPVIKGSYNYYEMCSASVRQCFVGQTKTVIKRFYYSIIFQIIWGRSLFVFMSTIKLTSVILQALNQDRNGTNTASLRILKCDTHIQTSSRRMLWFSYSVCSSIGTMQEG